MPGESSKKNGYLAAFSLINVLNNYYNFGFLDFYCLLCLFCYKLLSVNKLLRNKQIPLLFILFIIENQ